MQTETLIAPREPSIDFGAPAFAVRVYGTPAPGGSKHAFVLRGRNGQPIKRANGSIIVNMVDDANRSRADGSKPNLEWKSAVKAAAHVVMVREGLKPFDCPIFVRVVFLVKRPRGHWGSGRNANSLKPSAPRFPAVKPDATKLWRSTEDAMNGVVQRDDCLFVDQFVSKRYCGDGEPDGAIIEVYTL